MVGACELIFPLDLSVATGEDGLPRGSVLGARVAVTPDGGAPTGVGFARPERPVDLVCMDFMGRSTPTLHLYLQPNQVAALEALRAAGDLTFDLAFVGTGVDGHGDQHLHGKCSIRVPCSEWLRTLRGAGARDVMLLEVPLPLVEDGSDRWKEVASSLRSAEEDYGNGNYRGCIAACRIAIDQLGGLLEVKWGRALSRLAEDRAGTMTKTERQKAVYAALRHYPHAAHHASDDGAENSYSRAEAEFTLSAAVAAVRLAQMG